VIAVLSLVHGQVGEWELQRGEYAHAERGGEDAREGPGASGVAEAEARVRASVSEEVAKWPARIDPLQCSNTQDRGAKTKGGGGGGRNGKAICTNSASPGG